MEWRRHVRALNNLLAAKQSKFDAGFKQYREKTIKLHPAIAVCKSA